MLRRGEIELRGEELQQEIHTVLARQLAHGHVLCEEGVALEFLPSLIVRPMRGLERLHPLLLLQLPCKEFPALRHPAQEVGQQGEHALRAHSLYLRGIHLRHPATLQALEDMGRGQGLLCGTGLGTAAKDNEEVAKDATSRNGMQTKVEEEAREGRGRHLLPQVEEAADARHRAHRQGHLDA